MMFQALFCLLSGFIVLLFPLSNAAADSCPRGNYIYHSGIGCTLNTRPGEWVTVVASYHEGRRIQRSDYAVIVIPSTGRRERVRPNQTVRFTYLARSTREEIRYEIPTYDDSDRVTIRAFTKRTNLVMTNLWMDTNTGDIHMTYGVGPEAVFRPLDRVCIDLWYAKGGTPTNFVAERCLDECVGKRNCAGHKVVRRQDRRPMALGEHELIAIIDPHNRHPETSGNDNQVREVIDDFFIEKVPQIMNNVPARQKGPWAVPANILKTWFSRDSFENVVPGEKLEWQTPVPGGKQLKIPVLTHLVSMDWMLNPNTARNRRVINTFNFIIQPTIFLSSPAKRELSKLLSRKFLRTSRNLIQISKLKFNGQYDWERYHGQHVQHTLVQKGGTDALLAPLDSITAALGGHSFYAVPFGVAKKLRKKNKIRVTIDRVAIHMADMFDYRGFQPLGCWKTPNLVQKVAIPGDGFDCIYNATFRLYRAIKKRGGDFVLLAQPKFVNFTSPLSFEVKLRQRRNL